jgi:hypothetical protein
MSNAIATRLAPLIRETAASVAWTQWTALGGMASSRKRATSLVDPEALLLVSLTFRDHEPRLWDVLRAWMPIGVRLLSVQRTKNLARAFPPSLTGALNEFACLAVQEGKDARWKSLIGGGRYETVSGRRKTWDVTGAFIEAPALMMRLRQGLGVGLRADALSYLLARQGQWVAVRPVAKALGFTDAATRRALDDLAGARLIHSTVEDQPTTYFAKVDTWRNLLEISQVPRWCGWLEIFALFASLDALWNSTEQRDVTDYAAGVLLREKLQEHRGAFAALSDDGGDLSTNGFDAPDLERLITWVLREV